MNISVYKPVVNFASVCTEFKEKVADLFVKRVTTLTHDDQDYERKNCLHDKIRERVLTIAEESLQFSCKAQEARVAGEKRVMQHSIERY